MLALPERGINRSVKTHNSDLATVCDWIEASVLFVDDELSKTDVVDVLIENEVYDSQDFALEFIDSAWTVMQSRISTLNGTLDVLHWTRERIARQGVWQDFPAYAFCLALTCGSYVYPQWAANYGYDSSTQGSLFERIALKSFSSMLPGWEVQLTGWSPDNPVRLRDTINQIIGQLNEVANAEIDVHVDQNANELGLDLLAFYSFGDNHASLPMLMIQCASGKDWKTKRHTPDLTIWNKVINFNSPPVKGFAIPYSFVDGQEFRRQATRVNGVFLDRYRLLNPNRGTSPVWNEVNLNTDLIAWVQPRVDALPRIDV